MNDQTVEEQIRGQFEESIELFKQLSDQAALIRRIGDLMTQTLRNRGKLLICGNGGSASDAQHFAGEFIGRFQRERSPLPAIALCSDTAILTALANDYDYEQVFSKQVEALGSENDMLVGLSTSGNSKNVINAVDTARQQKMTTVALLGKGGGALASRVDHAIVVRSDFSARIQEGHIAIIHIWCKMVEDALFPSTGD